MNHDEIVQHVATVLRSVDYEVRTEYRPNPDGQLRADLVAFNRDSRRPEIVAEIKPVLHRLYQVEEAVTQVTKYAQLLQAETPASKVLPLVVADVVTIDTTPWRNRALVWSSLMLNPSFRKRTHIERDLFLDQHEDRCGAVPTTYRPGLVSTHSPTTGGARLRPPM